VILNVATVPGDDRLVDGVGGTLAAELPQVISWPALRFNTFWSARAPVARATIVRRLSHGPPDLAPSAVSSSETARRPGGGTAVD